MKKTLFLIVVCFVFLYTNLSAQTGLDVIRACCDAMKLDKLDSAQTFTIKSYIYSQGQKISVKIFYKNYIEGDDTTHKIRIEQSTMGKTDAFVITEDEFYRVLPNYEELDVDDAGTLQMIIDMIIPTNNIAKLLEDTTNKLTINLAETSDFNGKKCKKVSIALTEKPEEISQYLYFDEATNWAQGADIPANKSTVIFDAMKKKKGYVYPSTIKIMSNGKKQLEVEIDEFELNTELDDSMFAKTKK